MNQKKQYKGKIGYCDNVNLPGMRKIPGGHYVYIRAVRGGNVMWILSRPWKKTGK